MIKAFDLLIVLSDVQIQTTHRPLWIKDSFLIDAMSAVLLFARVIILSIFSKDYLRTIPTKRTLFGYREKYIIFGWGEGTGIQLMFLQLAEIPSLTTYAYLVQFIFIILLTVVLKQIIKTEREFKRYSGHYSLRPPKGFYD